MVMIKQKFKIHSDFFVGARVGFKCASRVEGVRLVAIQKFVFFLRHC